jgi:prevent-host-death family protein
MAMKQWQLQEAKAKFSEVVRGASSNEPQEITVHGQPTVVILSKALYDKLRKPKKSFTQFMRSSPFYGLDIEFEREKSKTRDIDL